LLAIVLRDSDWFEVLWVGLVGDAGGDGGEAVAVVVVMAPAGTVPSPWLDNTPRVAAFVDLLPEVDRGSVVKAGLECILVLMPCATLVASGLLYFLFIVATRGRVTSASSGSATDQCGFTMALRPRGRILSGGH
jgi:hypothetical protein